VIRRNKRELRSGAPLQLSTRAAGRRGGAARADNMIENAINEFSYRVYEKLLNPQKEK
jgi:hypothetical protein